VACPDVVAEQHGGEGNFRGSHRDGNWRKRRHVAAFQKSSLA